MEFLFLYKSDKFLCENSNRLVPKFKNIFGILNGKYEPITCYHTHYPLSICVLNVSEETLNLQQLSFK